MNNYTDFKGISKDILLHIKVVKVILQITLYILLIIGQSVYNMLCFSTLQIILQKSRKQPFVFGFFNAIKNIYLTINPYKLISTKQ